jgi:hypothetical protein
MRAPVDVVGLGFMGSRWARVHVRVVCDVREAVGRESAAWFGARFVADPLEAAADPRVVGVVVRTCGELGFAVWPSRVRRALARARLEPAPRLMAVLTLRGRAALWNTRDRAFLCGWRVGTVASAAQCLAGHRAS